MNSDYFDCLPQYPCRIELLQQLLLYAHRRSFFLNAVDAFAFRFEFWQRFSVHYRLSARCFLLSATNLLSFHFQNKKSSYTLKYSTSQSDHLHSSQPNQETNNRCSNLYQIHKLTLMLIPNYVPPCAVQLQAS